MREAARLQTFPDWFTFRGRTIRKTSSLIGSAVPPLLAQYLGRSIVAYLDALAAAKLDAVTQREVASGRGDAVLRRLETQEWSSEAPEGRRLNGANGQASLDLPGLLTATEIRSPDDVPPVARGIGLPGPGVEGAVQLLDRRGDTEAEHLREVSLTRRSVTGHPAQRAEPLEVVLGACVLHRVDEHRDIALVLIELFRAEVCGLFDVVE